MKKLILNSKISHLRYKLFQLYFKSISKFGTIKIRKKFLMKKGYDVEDILPAKDGISIKDNNTGGRLSAKSNFEWIF
jgi:hypothetical protein